MSLFGTGLLFVFRRESGRGILFWGHFEKAGLYRWTELIETRSVNWPNRTGCLTFFPFSPEDEYGLSFVLTMV
jgi:hypothetical protein